MFGNRDYFSGLAIFLDTYPNVGGEHGVSLVDLFIFGQPFVKRFAICYRSGVCLSVLSVMFVHCGQTVGRIKTKLSVQVGLGPGHIVLDGDPAPPPPKGHSLQ